MEGVPEARDFDIKWKSEFIAAWIRRNHRCLHASKRRYELVSFALVHWEYRRAAKRALEKSALLYPLKRLAAKLASVFLGFPTDIDPLKQAYMNHNPVFAFPR